ncbi:hypothetical protein BJ138DRAFT_1116681 [Hygrophoropsis aurantiaca]|uniref:Uncharacterized protein n=1 Tax=Hygrophoropsis aurantiaca TaxID=72124 RepID=A0ACB8A3X3_9AGAM|nr:hypothetical protein BJ138DRAFT_1116681 [Hygrophoropsis aurantiaca]
MLRSFTRLPLRRCVHTHARHSSTRMFARQPARVGIAVGLSVAAASYLTWFSDSQRIALDDQPVSAPKKRPAAAKPTPSSSEPAPAASSPPPHSAELEVTEVQSEPLTKEEFMPETDAPPLTPPQPEGEGEGEESAGGGAYDPVTGEINWDCPCLGGMAHGPCGPQFREAFSCFIYSESEPKGIDCVEKFKAMQDCFREHPEIYAEEIMDDDDDEPVSETVEGAPVSAQPEPEEPETPTTPTPTPTS